MYRYIAFIIVLLFVSCTQKRAIDPRPDIILIVADDLGIGALSCYNKINTKIKTPILDTLASKGWMFNQFYVTSPVCSPSRASILCGKQPRDLHLEQVLKPSTRDEQHGLSTSSTTIASLLKNNGYQTSLVGKWHLGYTDQEHPTNNGFENFSGFLNGHIDYISHQDPTGQYKLMKGKDSWNAPKNKHLTEVLTDEAIARINDADDQPLFMMVSYANPHVPILLPGDEALWPGKKRSKLETPDKYQQIVNLLDLQVGRLINAAYSKNKNTMIIFLSDHGSPVYLKGNYPYTGGKGTLHEGGLRVPAIISWPEKISPKMVQNFCTSLDLFNTILEASETENITASGIDGNSLLSKNFSHDSVSFVWSFNSHFAIRKNNLKAIFIPDQFEEKVKNKYLAEFHNLMPNQLFTDSTGSHYWVWLYDLQSDSLEQINLASQNLGLMNTLWSELNTQLKTQSK